MVSSVHCMYVFEVKVDSITALLCLITYVQGGEKKELIYYLANYTNKIFFISRILNHILQPIMKGCQAKIRYNFQFW